MRLVTGLQPVREAIRVHGEKIERILVEKDGGPQIDAVARFAEDRGAKVQRVARGELDRASKGARHQGAIAYAPELALIPLDALVNQIERTVAPSESGADEESADEESADEESADEESADEESAAEAKPAGATVIVALDEIEDPQNFGAVIRSAVALGAEAVLWPEHHAAPLSPATFRASAGAVEHARLCRVSSLTTALDRLREAGAIVIGLDGNAERTLRDVATNGAPVVLVVGAEGKGLRRPVKRACSEIAKLPMSNAIDSLNASVAAGIALYEILSRHA